MVLTFLAKASSKQKINFSECNVENLDLPSQATAIWSSSTLLFKEFLNLNIFSEGITKPKNDFLEYNVEK